MKTRCCFIFALLLTAARPASACSVPVFRYALNYWPADLYELHGGAQLKLPDDTINLEFKPDKSARLVYGDQEIWSGELTKDNLPALLDSPVRKQLISRILHGDSVVWLLVESGDAAKDNAAADALTKRLKYLESIAVVPELRPDDPFNRLGPGPTLTIRHSVLRISRKDPREMFTLAMLERGKGDASSPTAYPVFGRGRVLIALPQEKLTHDNIDEVALFLTSACSCEVKDNRQGWDLLLTVDWEEELTKVEMKRLNGEEDKPTEAPATRPATQAVRQSDLKPETVTIEAHTTPPAAATTPPPVKNWSTTQFMIAGIAVAALGVCGGIWMRKRP
jgi:hypothetical protein